VWWVRNQIPTLQTLMARTGMDDRKRITILPDKRPFVHRMRSWWERWATLAREVRAEDAAMKKDGGEGLLERLFIPVLFAIMLLPLPLWPFIKHGDWNQDFWYTIKLAVPPIFLTLLIGSRLFMPRFWATSDWLGRGVTFVVATAMLAFLAIVPVAAINRWYGESEAVIVSGIVLDKLNNREGAYGVRLKTSDGEVKVRVPAREYDQIVVGGQFSKRYMKGSLGLLYRDD
jgi:hypothetical protein